MLGFDESSVKAQLLAIHYARKIGDDYVIGFMSSKAGIASSDEAMRIAKAFWKMTDLAIDDKENDIIVDGVVDLEFWMHKLFNKVSGYFKLNGYEDQWHQAADEYNASL